MEEPLDELDAKIRNLSVKAPPLPSDFQDRVWQEIQERDLNSATPGVFGGWFSGTFVASISPMRLLTTSCLAAIVISGSFGVWIGNIALSKNRSPEVLNSLSSPPALSIFEL